MQSGCKIEIAYIDPETYTSIVGHPLRKQILTALYAKALQHPLSKQELADSIGLGYHQLIYQLNHQMTEFWKVVDEKKIRGTRMELIEPSYPHSVFITLGKERRIFLIDPLAKLYGPLDRVGTRCDGCTQKVADKCLDYVKQGCTCLSTPGVSELSILRDNGRMRPFKPLDRAILCGLKGITTGEKCVVSIPCEGCAFLKRPISIDGL